MRTQLLSSCNSSRPEANGKFIYAGRKKILAIGPTYGAFAPNEKKEEYWFDELIEKDFSLMVESGFNAVRIPHTMPPVSLLDAAERHGLRVMVGLSAEQYAGFLADPHKKSPNMRRLIQEKVKPVAGHPALLCYALGNEIPASMVRWIGKRKVERYLESLYEAVKEEDPEGIVTYVNYPSTEYLELPFLDALAFNVYLESQERLEAYLARLHSLAGDRPLLMSELGLDAMRNGEEKQAETLTWQLQTVLRSGCAGAYIFSWTDEWHRAGQQVDDWAFGLTTIDRKPKPALKAVAETLQEGVFPKDTPWPKVSVVVCSYNGSRTIRQTLEALQSVDYPDFEVIVVDDGSTDSTPQIAAEYKVQLFSQKNMGLSGARNTGADLATGSIIAYIDDDAYPDKDWLRFLAWTYLNTAFDAVGGPNITPREDPLVSQAVAHAPGGAIHVLISDTEAEHIPGCNMSFRKAALQAIGGFDPRFRAAGDDVDACWKLLSEGMKIGFNPAAVVWHHRRSSVRAYWKQQCGYGKAEALLEQKWPEKYNAIGHVSWAGRVYGNEVLRPVAVFQEKVYQGMWGSAPFQSLYQPSQGLEGYLPTMPEWYLATPMLLAMGLVGLTWPPMSIAGLVGILGVVLTVSTACQRGFSTRFQSPLFVERFKASTLTSLLSLIQPAARLTGRLKEGLSPWNRGKAQKFMWPYQSETAIWCEDWREPTQRIWDVEQALKALAIVVARGGDFDGWDLEVRGGLFGAARVLFAVEDHGAGTQYVRVRIKPQYSLFLRYSLAVLATVFLIAILSGRWTPAVMLAIAAITLTILMIREAGGAFAEAKKAINTSKDCPEREAANQSFLNGKS